MKCEKGSDAWNKFEDFLFTNLIFGEDDIFHMKEFRAGLILIFFSNIYLYILIYIPAIKSWSHGIVVSLGKASFDNIIFANPCWIVERCMQIFIHPAVHSQSGLACDADLPQAWSSLCLLCISFVSLSSIPLTFLRNICVRQCTYLTSYGRHVEVLDRTMFGGRASTRIALGTTRSRAHGELAPKCWKYEISVHASHSSSRQSEVARHQGLWHNCGTKNEWSLMLHRRCVKQCWSYAI